MDGAPSSSVSARRSIGDHRGAWLFAALVVLSAAHVWRRDGAIGTVTSLVVTVGAGIVALFLAARLPRDRRAPWLWLAAGMASSGLADLLFEIIAWRNGANPDLSIADVFYLATYVLLGIGLFQLCRRRRGVDGDLLLDLGSFVLLALIVVYQVGDIDGIFSDRSVPMTVRLVWAAYPMLDAVLLAMLGKAVLTGRMRGTPGVVLNVGIGCWLAADFATMLIGDANVESVWMDLGWMWGAAAVAIAITRVESSSSEPAVAPRESLNLLLGMVPLAVPGVVEIWAHLNGSVIHPVPMFAATLLLVAIAFARSLRILRAREEQEVKLARSERYFRVLAQNSAEAVFVVGADGRLLRDEPNLMRLIGSDKQVEAGATVVDLLLPEEHERLQTIFDHLRANSGAMSELTFRAVHADGGDRWFGVRALNMTDDPDIGGLVVNLYDITDRTRVQDELTHLAFHDTLTGLPNRALFNDRLEHAMQRNERTGFDVAIVYLDLDGFKTVNDSLGHDTGDDVLRQTATRLRSAVRPADTVARLGGDEFAILIEVVDEPLTQATAVADRVLQAMAIPMRVGDDEMALSASIGIAISDLGSTSSSMLRDADIAMYQAKSSGKGRWAVYDAAMRSAVVERMELETDLVRAIQERQFELMYQPIIRLSTGELTGFEALLRWRHPTRGLLLPDLFVPILEETGGIVEIGEWVLNEACHTAAEWHRRHPAHVTLISVNVSARELAAPNLVDHVRGAIARTGLDPGSLILELTESCLVHDPAMVARQLGELHKLGVKIAIDDFGTGYSSLSYLRQFPVDILKIDQSFVRTITEQERAPAVLRGLLDLARTLDLETIAEGIEVDAQRVSLLDQHCDFGQGFLYAHPLSNADAEDLVDHESVQRSLPA